MCLLCSSRVNRRSVLSGFAGSAAVAAIAGCSSGGSLSAERGSTAPAAAPPSAGKFELVLLGIYGPGPAGGLPPAFGGGQAPTVNPADPTPGTAAMTEKAHEAYAYNSNIFMRDVSSPDIRTLAHVHEIAIPAVGASYTNTAPAMRPFLVMRDDRVQVTATLVPHGPVFPAFAYRFDTQYGSVTFSGDTTETDNLIILARDTDILVHEAINIAGADLKPELRNHLLQSHVAVQVVGSIAQKAQAKKLVLSHIGDHVERPINIDKWTKWAKHGYHGPVSVGQDLQRFVVSA